MVKFLLLIYNVLFPILFFLYLPVFLYKLTRRGNYKAGFWERFSIYSSEKRQKISACKCPIWIHAVSVGETVAALSFINEWCQRDDDPQFILSSTTSTGQSIARKQANERIIPIYFPLDFFVFTTRALSIVKPLMIIIFEVEIWPNLITVAAAKNIDISIVNCRISDNSAKGYQKYKFFFKHIFAKFSIICTQTKEDATRIESISGEPDKIVVCNTMKFDQFAGISTADAQLFIDHLCNDTNRIVFTAASTHPGEEKIMTNVLKSLSTTHPNLLLVIIPRHVERTAEIEQQLKKDNINYALMTELRDHLGSSTNSEPENSVPKNTKTLVVNATGEMLHYLHLSDIVFVGKSLGKNKGGHNIIEPALFGKPIIFGPYMNNFKDVVKEFKSENACIEVNNETDLHEAIHDLILNQEKRLTLGKRAKFVVDKNRGAIDKTIGLLQKQMK